MQSPQNGPRALTGDNERLVEIVSRGYGQGKHGTNDCQLRTPGSGWPILTPVDKIKQSKRE
jgi:hypothetical protein